MMVPPVPTRAVLMVRAWPSTLTVRLPLVASVAISSASWGILTHGKVVTES